MTPARLAIALTIALAGTSLPTSAATGSTGETCHGVPATLVASSGDVDGTDGNDVIVVTGKVHYLDAKGGDDLVCVLDVTKTPTVWSGLGNDVIDASGATGKVSAALGAGTDTFIGSPYDDSVSVAQHTEEDAPPGPATITTGAGRDYVTISRGYVADVRTGAGRDTVIYRSSDGVSPSSFDLGAGRDGINIEDDFEGDPDAGRTSLTVDLRREFFDWHGTRSTLRAAEAVHGAALEVTLLGTDQDNDFWAHGCEVLVKGKGGADSILLSSERMDQAPFIDTDCPKDYRLRAFGNGGHDYLEGGWRHDELIGGPGYDKAFGDRGGNDVCVAEVRVGKGCRGA